MAFPQTRWDLAVELENKVTVHNPVNVEKNDKHT